MTDAACLLAAVLADPFDDAPRLCLADELEATEPGRAEFIRVQCALARLKEPTAKEFVAAYGAMGAVNALAESLLAFIQKRDRLRARERALWDAGSAAWFAPTGLVVRLNGDFGHPGPVGFVARGFVGRVECTMASFLGGPCLRCEGRGVNAAALGGVAVECPHGRDVCPDCDRCPACVNGRTPGLAGTLAATCPVESIVLTDREPLDMTGMEEPRWIWAKAGDSPVLGSDRADHYILPAEIYARLVGFFQELPGYGLKRYSTADAARLAMSAACVLHTRSVAPGRTHEARCERCKGRGVAVIPKPNGMALGEAPCSGCSGSGVVRKPGLPPLAPANPDPRRPAPLPTGG